MFDKNRGPIGPSLCQINSSPIRCFSELSLFYSCNQSFIPPKYQLQQMKWKTEWEKKAVGILLGWSCYYMFVKFPFGTEIRLSQKNHEGWLVGVWDGNSWDPSQRFRSWSQQNPNRRCSTKLPQIGQIKQIRQIRCETKKLLLKWRWSICAEHCVTAEMILQFFFSSVEI